MHWLGAVYALVRRGLWPGSDSGITAFKRLLKTSRNYRLHLDRAFEPLFECR